MDGVLCDVRRPDDRRPDGAANFGPTAQAIFIVRVVRLSWPRSCYNSVMSMLKRPKNADV